MLNEMLKRNAGCLYMWDDGYVHYWSLSCALTEDESNLLELDSSIVELGLYQRLYSPNS